ncbi:SRPBCC family protein [Methylobacterium sp. A54F]
MRACPTLLLSGLLLAASAALAHGPTPQKVAQSIVIKAKPDAVWRVAGPFGALSGWHPDVERGTATGDAPGATRTLTLRGGGTLRESLDERKDAERSYSYRMSEPDLKALPVSSYSATLALAPEGEGTRVSWSGRFYRGDTGNEPPDELNDAAGKAAMERWFGDGLKGLKAKLEAQPSQ